MSKLLEQVDTNRSIWTLGKSYAALPPLNADCTADVAIIGGGFTGVSTAWHLARQFPERRIVVLEARQLGNGGSGRNGGLMLSGINGVHSPDAEHARTMYDLTVEGMDLIESMIRDNGLDVPHHRDGAYEVFTSNARADEAGRWVEEARAAGIPLEFGDAAIDLEGAKGAVRDPNAGHLDGLALVRAMRPVLVDLGVGVYEDTPVLKVHEGGTIVLDTPHAQVRCGAIVLATNAYTPRLGYFKESILPLQSHLIATEARSPQQWEAMGWRGRSGFSDDLDRVAFGCMTSSGQVVFGGGSNRAYDYLIGGRTHQPDTRRGSQAVEQRLRRYLPRADVPVAHRWTGTVASTLSRLCAMGVRGEHRNVYYAFGYSGHGVVMANLAGRILCDIYAGNDERWRNQPFYQPRMWPLPPEPLRWLGYKAYTIFTGRSPRKR